MATLNVSLPEPLKRFVEAQAGRGGYGSASEYVRELLREALRRRENEELEAKLLDALREAPREMTRARWGRLRQQVRTKQRARRR